jgi:hypothetical protein
MALTIIYEHCLSLTASATPTFSLVAGQLLAALKGKGHYCEEKVLIWIR